MHVAIVAVPGFHLQGRVVDVEAFAQHPGHRGAQQCGERGHHLPLHRRAQGGFAHHLGRGCAAVAQQRSFDVPAQEAVRAIPEFARQAGFERPILHGMCTYGFTARALLHAVADSDPDHFGGFSARFSKTVDPGDTLTVSIWRTEDGALFQTAKQTGDIVVDRGVMTLR